MKWYLHAFKNYSNFKGRARRKEYWMFLLMNFLFAVIALLLDLVIGTGILVYILYSLVSLVPLWAVSARRLHDVGKSGWMFLIAFIPAIGGIWLLILMATDSQVGSNKWGPNPKEDNLSMNQRGGGDEIVFLN
jgi:hypothetical protein